MLYYYRLYALSTKYTSLGVSWEKTDPRFEDYHPTNLPVEKISESIKAPVTGFLMGTCHV